MQTLPFSEGKMEREVPSELPGFLFLSLTKALGLVGVLDTFFHYLCRTQCFPPLNL